MVLTAAVAAVDTRGLPDSRVDRRVAATERDVR